MVSKNIRLKEKKNERILTLFCTEKIKLRIKIKVCIYIYNIILFVIEKVKRIICIIYVKDKSTL